MRSEKCEVKSGEFEEAAGRARLQPAARRVCGAHHFPRMRPGIGVHSTPYNFKLQTSHFKLGFNLVETLAASMILSGAVLTLGAISTNALTSTRLYRHYETAASVIDHQLTLIDQVGVDQFIEAGQMEGLYEQSDPVCQWAVTTEYTGTDNLYLVKITVTWLEGKKPYSIAAQTMLNGVSLVTGTGTETGEQPTR